MEPATTQHQFFVFLDMFGQFTKTVTSALFYAGIFVGFIVFPIYAVIFLRRRTQDYMERVLDEIADRDPWMLAASRGQGIFDSELPFRWLDDLCTWHTRYHGISKFFGSPDLEAKCVQVTKALLAVFLSWTPEIREMPDAKRERLTELLRRLQKYTSPPALKRLLGHVTLADDPLAWIRPLQKTAAGVKSWQVFLQRTGIPIHLTPPQAAAHEELTREKIALALLLFVRENFPYQDKIREFLATAHRRDGQNVRLCTVLVDRFLGDDGSLVNSLREVLEGVTDAQRMKVKHPAWEKFVLAFGKTPLEMLNAELDESFSAVKRKWHQRMSEIQVGELGKAEATEQAKTVDLAWQVVLALRKDGLIK